jgi:hypothetical protein
LPKIILTLRPPGRLARGLHAGKQNRDERADNRNHDEQLNERKTRFRRRLATHTVPRLRFELEIAMIEILLDHVRRRRPFHPRRIPWGASLCACTVKAAARLSIADFGMMRLIVARSGYAVGPFV